LEVARPFVTHLQAADHSIPDSILNRIHQDVRLIDHCMMHSLFEHLLELGCVFSNRDLSRLWESGLLSNLSFPCRAESFEAMLVLIQCLFQQLLLVFIKVFHGDVDDVVPIHIAWLGDCS
jgi:hypothetical protein